MSSELLTAAQMRAIETAAIESGDVTGLELMERAGRGVVEAVFEEWPELAAAPHRALVLCGPGNNGGDGFVVARLLKEWGWEVDVFLYGDPDKLPPDAKTNYERWTAIGTVQPYVDTGKAAFWLEPSQWGENDLVFDALFGTGLTRSVTGFNAFGWATQMSGWRIPDGVKVPAAYPGARVVAIDIPSGLCSDSGRYLRDGTPDPQHEDIKADLTVSFHALKAGHVLSEGPAACGTVRVKGIGLDHAPDPAIAMQVHGPSTRHTLGKWPHDHKYAHGHVLILSGGPGKGGAGRLAARGALRIGAGLVTLGCPPGALQENAAQLNAAMLKSLGSDEDLELFLKGDPRINALCLGPGLGTGARERQLVAAALASGRACVLDADALTLIAATPELYAALHEGCVLTPHAGEFARLFPDLAETLNAAPTTGPAFSKVDAARDAAKRVGCTVLFKGPDTVIAAPDGRASINSAHYDRAAPWLATAGSGDVLAGFIAGLLARGFDPIQATETAAWLHVECARSFGPGLIAEDLPETLPHVYRDLGL